MTRPEFTRAAVLRGGSLVAAGGVASTVLAAVLTTILGVELGDAGFGSYAFVVATAGLLAAVARVSVDPIVVRDIARSFDEGHARGSRRPILTALILTVGVSTVITLLVISPVGIDLLERIGDIERSMVFALAVMFVTQALYIVNAESLRGLHRLGGAAFLGLPVQRTVSLGLVAWAVYVASADMDPTLAVWLVAASSAAAVVASGTVLWITIRGLPGGRPSRRDAAQMARDGAPVAVTNVLGLTSTRLPIWVLPMVGDLAGAGVFALATAFVVLIRFGHKTMANTLSPFVARAYHEGAHEALERKVRAASAAATVAALAASAALVVAGTLVVPRLFPKGFEDAVAVAAILLIGTVATAAAGPCGLLLNVTGNERWMATASAISVVVAVIVVFPAAAAGGAVGAAIVMAATALLRVGLQVRFVKRRTGITTTADFRGLIRSLRPAR